MLINMVFPKNAAFNAKAILYLIFFFLIGEVHAQNKSYDIDITNSSKAIIYNGLDLGGVNNKGNSIAVNNYYISINKKPIIPVTGEFHFSRYPEQYWDESIKKMKAGGITIIATYVFWNLHEEKENVFNWDGNRNLRKFVKICADNDMPVIVRIGPFCHGEIRNGGLPDWLLPKPYSVRSNDPGYLAEVEKLYNEIGKQLKGLYFKDGGPIIGTQIENEFQHSAAPWGLTYPGQPYDYTAAERDLGVTHFGVSVSETKNPYQELGNNHMKILKQLAIKAGIQTPLYTATGWGNAAIIEKGSLPVTAAYAYPTWTKKADISPFYLYKDLTKTPDYSPVSYNPQEYPAFAAELGSGIMCTYTRRPLVPAKSLDALVNRCLGSGVNGLGYYMFHGGSTPKGDFFFQDEAGGSPKISYDFQAPIGEFGQIRPSFQRLKPIHFFLKDFGDLLAPMVLTLPQNNKDIKPTDLETLRYSVRSDGEHGFLFINNFQDDLVLTDKKSLSVNVKTKTETISFPISIKSGENAIYPFNLMVGGANLKFATAQLMMKSEDSKLPYYVFFINDGEKPVFVFSKSKGLKIKNSISSNILQTAKEWKVLPAENQNSEFLINLNGKQTKILVLTKETALKSYVLDPTNKKVLCFTNALPLQNGDEIKFLSTGNSEFDFSIYPKNNLTPKLSDGKLSSIKNRLFDTFSVNLPKYADSLNFTQTSDRKIQVSMPSPNKQIEDFFLNIDYVGDTGMAFIDGKLITDNLYKGLPWQIGLKQYMFNKKGDQIQFYFRPMYKGAPYLVDLKSSDIPDFSKTDKYIKINNVSLTPQYKAFVKF
ncbi:beta-galactosidase [Pedobacter sp. SD-b]|uniref:Beta-galactosidase n=1 Tax=Pedobacter segetis TaxID=2793069 RepID=A0ABS1BL57_9SPHI|nr:beta-galactosidase [Pedobacter segetis]MBK0383625.1 beta-galactosidase [Pedobacter segetis]